MPVAPAFYDFGDLPLKQSSFQKTFGEKNKSEMTNNFP